MISAGFKRALATNFTSSFNALFFLLMQVSGERYSPCSGRYISCSRVGPSPHWAQPSLAIFFQLAKSAVPGTDLRCGTRRFFGRPDRR
jgi:hypothetical protein